jgi:hypothetical protein
MSSLAMSHPGYPSRGNVVRLQDQVQEILDLRRKDIIAYRHPCRYATAFFSPLSVRYPVPKLFDRSSPVR